MNKIILFALVAFNFVSCKGNRKVSPAAAQPSAQPTAQAEPEVVKLTKVDEWFTEGYIDVVSENFGREARTSARSTVLLVSGVVDNPKRENLRHHWTYRVDSLSDAVKAISGVTHPDWVGEFEDFRVSIKTGATPAQERVVGKMVDGWSYKEEIQCLMVDGEWKLFQF